MIVACPECHRYFDDEFRTTLCPHVLFYANDGKNHFALHPEAYLSDAPPPKPRHRWTPEEARAAGRKGGASPKRRGPYKRRRKPALHGA